MSRIRRPHSVEPVLLEYPGYGPRPGTPSVLTGAALDAMEALGAEGKPVWLAGGAPRDLGRGGRHAREPDLVRGLLLVTPFADLATVRATAGSAMKAMRHSCSPHSGRRTRRRRTPPTVCARSSTSSLGAATIPRRADSFQACSPCASLLLRLSRHFQPRACPR